MELNITDPAFLFPGISLLFLAYTNRYLTLAGDTIARATFIASLATLAISLLMALIEILLSGISLRIELDRTRNKN